MSCSAGTAESATVSSGVGVAVWESVARKTLHQHYSTLHTCTSCTIIVRVHVRFLECGALSYIESSACMSSLCINSKGGV